MESFWQVGNEDDKYEMRSDGKDGYVLFKKSSEIIVGMATLETEGEEGLKEGMEDKIGSTHFPHRWVVQVGDETVYIGPDEQMAIEMLWQHRHKSKF